MQTRLTWVWGERATRWAWGRRAVFATLSLVFSWLTDSIDAQAGMIVFQSDFESGMPSQITGNATIVSVEGYQGIGNAGNVFSGNLMVNKERGFAASTTTLILSNLPTHSSIQIGFLLAIINSWDGSSENDRFEVLLDGQTLFSETFDNYFTNDQTYVPSASVQLTDRIDQPPYDKTFSDLGFTLDAGDAGYDMYYEPSLQSIAHSASTATIVWRATLSGGFIPPNDEFWGIDNLTITLDGTQAVVPEPSTAIIAGMFGLVGGFRQLRRSYRK
ncbi:MAG: hypothetical protein WCI02_16465 [Planctomycetota bacterium]